MERFFRTLNESILRALPGYTGSNVQQRPKEAEQDANLTLHDLEKVIVSFIVDRHNQDLDARMGDQTRNQRWESGLTGNPPVLSERELDICLMKTLRRTVQRGGQIQFENVMYQGEYLAGYAGQTVSIRYNPKDITTIWIYRVERGKEEFLTRAHAQGLEAEHLSIDEARASAKRLRDVGKSITNQTILYDVIDRASQSEISKPTRKQRQQQEQVYKKPVALSLENTQDIQSEELSFDSRDLEVGSEDESLSLGRSRVDSVPASSIDEMEVWDYEQMREDYGW